MKVQLNRLNQDVNFEAQGMTPVKVLIDGSPDVGGVEAGARPMELVLMALGSCSAIDLVSILKKQRQEIIDFKIEVEGQRTSGAVPSPFTAIHLKFMLWGNIDKTKAERAAQLSVEKYCSVQVMLAPTVNITWSVELH